MAARARRTSPRSGVRRVGLITGGGDCPGLNAVIRAAVRALLPRGIEAVGILDGFAGLVEGHVRPLARKDVSGLVGKGGTILGSSNRDNPFDYAVRRGGRVTGKRDASADCLRTIRRNRLDALIVIGGDGTLAIAEAFARRGVRLVGVPKTIDNDLGATDVTFGFDTALHVATDAIDRLRTTAESHHRAMVVEVMGRTAGWIALRSGIAGGAHVVLVPEIPFDHVRVAAVVAERARWGRSFSIVVVAEGAAPRGGAPVVARLVEGSPEAKRLGGIGTVVSAEIEERTGVEARATTLGHVQRGGSPSPFDRVLATRFGVAAAEAVAAGRFGTMAALRTPEIVLVPLARAVRVRRVDPRGGDVAAARAIGVSFGDES